MTRKRLTDLRKNYKDFKYSLYREGEHVSDGILSLAVTKKDAKDGYYDQCFLISESITLTHFKSLGVCEGDAYYEIVITDPDNTIREWECIATMSIDLIARLKEDNQSETTAGDLI